MKYLMVYNWSANNQKYKKASEASLDTYYYEKIESTVVKTTYHICVRNPNATHKVIAIMFDEGECVNVVNLLNAQDKAEKQPLSDWCE